MIAIARLSRLSITIIENSPIDCEEIPIGNPNRKIVAEPMTLAIINQRHWTKRSARRPARGARVSPTVAAGGAGEHGGRAGAAVARPGDRAGRVAAVWLKYWPGDVQLHGRGVGASMSGLVLDSELSWAQERAGGNVVGVSNISAAMLASNTSDHGGSAAGVLHVLPVVSFLGVFRGSLVFRDIQNAAQKVEVARRLVISWWHPDLEPHGVHERDDVDATETGGLGGSEPAAFSAGRALTFVVLQRADVDLRTT
ncbi:unnamed protein product [Phytophthora fragariaefolia]|uniref:Unnamed protein product n=1 Tax=Phytophthora fragariaefolia TaxID=1490495 RepID=A0A9W7DEY7_9STRA|nr:unnamed protein product [Phytophthora fragariaefolia]